MTATLLLLGVPEVRMLRNCVLSVFAVAVFLVPAIASAQAGAAEGAKVFAASKCSMCHAVAGVGNKKIPLDGVGAKLSADQIREWILTPAEAAKKASSTAKPPMKAYANLPKADLDALVAYVKSLDKK